MDTSSLIQALKSEAVDEVIRHAVYMCALRRARLSGRNEIETQELYGLLDQVIDGPEYPIILEFAARFGNQGTVQATADAIQKAAR